LTKLSLKTNKILAGFWAALAFLGFLDAVYLTVSRYTGSTLNCYVVSGCDLVTTSAYSIFLGIPVALFGAAYYFSILVLSLAFLDFKKNYLLWAVIVLSPLGFSFSLVFTFIQAFVIKSYCFYCLLSALDSTLIFLTAVWFWRKTRRNPIISSENNGNILEEL